MEVVGSRLRAAVVREMGLHGCHAPRSTEGHGCGQWPKAQRVCSYESSTLGSLGQRCPRQSLSLSLFLVIVLFILSTGDSYFVMALVFVSAREKTTSKHVIWENWIWGVWDAPLRLYCFILNYINYYESFVFLCYLDP